MAWRLFDLGYPAGRFGCREDLGHGDAGAHERVGAPGVPGPLEGGGSITTTRVPSRRGMSAGRPSFQIHAPNASTRLKFPLMPSGGATSPSDAAAISAGGGGRAGGIPRGSSALR